MALLYMMMMIYIIRYVSQSMALSDISPDQWVVAVLSFFMLGR